MICRDDLGRPHEAGAQIGAYSVVLRRKYQDASGAASARISTDQASDASMGCCIDLQQRFRQALTDPSLPLRDRVRMACSLGAVFGGLLMAGNAFSDVSSDELGSLVRDAIRDIAAGPSA